MPFRKNFYVELPEIAQMTPEKVEAYREKLGINVAGDEFPKPIVSWAQADDANKVLERLKILGFKKPRPFRSS